MENKIKYLPFKYRYDFKQRREKYQKHLIENPTKVPIIIEPLPNSQLQPFANPRFCVSKDKDIIYLKISIKQKLQKMDPQKKTQRQSIFFYVGKQLLPQTSQNLQEFYNKHKDPDGFLYITYNEMEVF